MEHSVTVGYIGLHQAYQLALAAQEGGLLDRFHCSLFTRPGTWGGKLSALLGREALANRCIDGLPMEKITEYPWPMLRHRIWSKIKPSGSHDWFTAKDDFDRHVAHALETSRSRLFVGTETCAQRSFEVCVRRGLTRVLDCPQLYPTFLTRVLTEAAEQVKLATPAPVDTPAMAARKAAEYESAEHLLIYSEVHRRSFLEAGFPEERLFECPLWVDSDFWMPMDKSRSNSEESLRVLFVGGICLRKGVPFLLEAARSLGKAIRLTLVGAIHPELEPLLAQYAGCFEQRGPQTRAALRNIYSQHDVLVLPSIADSFGFVGLEAMACGLPVILTENCGVPAPDPSWRVPIMNAEALAARMEFYASHREAVGEDGAKAFTFSKQFSPRRYRHSVGEFLQRLVSAQSV